MIPCNSSQELEGRSLRVNNGPPPPKRDDFSFRGSRNSSNFDKPNRVHVSNLAWGVDDHALENFFRQQGDVVEAKVVYDRESGRSRGFGFVTFNSAEDVTNAIQSLDGAVSSWLFIFMLFSGSGSAFVYYYSSYAFPCSIKACLLNSCSILMGMKSCCSY